jgi:hypothetical protein
MVQPGDVLTVIFQDQPIGWVDVDESYPTHFYGRFRAAPGYAAGQSPLDEAIALSRLYDQAVDQAERSAIYDRERDLDKERAASIQFPELPVEIKEFSIHHSGEVYVELKQPPG